MKLRTRLLLASSLVVAAAVASVAYVSSRVIRVELKEMAAHKRPTTIIDPRSLVAPIAAHFERRGSFDRVDAVLRDERDRMLPGHELLLLDREARVIGATSLPAKTIEVTRRGPEAIEIGYRAGSTAARLRFRGNNAAVLSEGKPVATLWVIPEWRKPTRDPVRSANRLLLILVAIVGALSLLATALIGDRIAKPIERLTEAARRMPFGERVEVSASGEVGELARAFNQMSAQLEENERLRRAMVSDVAHELRTPLTNLRATIESIEDGIRSADGATIASLLDDVLLLQRLVDDLQTLALAEARQLQLHRVEIDVREEIERAARAYDGRVAVDIASGLTLSADRDRFQQIIVNLLQNAVRYTSEGKAISVSARHADGAIEIAVRDEGEGIAPEHLPRIFDRFYRVDPSRQRITGGAGLGLAIVKQLVELHGGTIRVTSEPGLGTTFTIVMRR